MCVLIILILLCMIILCTFIPATALALGDDGDGDIGGLGL